MNRDQRPEQEIRSPPIPPERPKAERSFESVFGAHVLAIRTRGRREQGSYLGVAAAGVVFAAWPWLRFACPAPDVTGHSAQEGVSSEGRPIRSGGWSPRVLEDCRGSIRPPPPRRQIPHLEAAQASNPPRAKRPSSLAATPLCPNLSPVPWPSRPSNQNALLAPPRRRVEPHFTGYTSVTRRDI